MKQPVRQIQISLFLESLPEGVHGMITDQGDRTADNYIIVLNANDDQKQNAKSFTHECMHIFNQDIGRGKKRNIQKMEAAIQQVTEALELDS